MKLVSVKDRLPKENEIVIVYGEGILPWRNFSIASYESDMTSAPPWVHCEECGDINRYDDCELDAELITHWMSLPKLPLEDK